MLEEYVTKKRMVSYYNQARIIKSLGSEVKNILEIGIFNSLFSVILRNNGYQVTTADYNPELKPDLLIDLTTDFVVPKEQFDAIVSFQVLEHIPYDDAEKALHKFVEATKKFIVISLPYNTLELCNLRFTSDFTSTPRHLLVQIPRFWSTKPITSEHCWELGLKGYPKSRWLSSLEKMNIIVKREFQDPLVPYHYFFILEKV